MERISRKDSLTLKRRGSISRGSFLRVSPAGRLEVDGKRLFKRSAVQDEIKTLRAIPLDARP